MTTTLHPTPPPTSTTGTTVASPVTDPTDPNTPATVEDAYATLVVAFSADPIVRWLLPDGARYLEHYPRILEAMGAPSLEHGSLDVGAAGTATAMWHPPDVELDDEVTGELVFTSIDPPRHAAVGEMLERMAEHHPDQPCWYLPFIGVDPAHQGRGHGSALLSVGLARADRDHLPAYLEASSPRNRALYERHGFEVRGEIRVADSPPLWPMQRDPS